MARSHNRSRKRGVAALELALIAPVFTALLMGVADLSQAYHRELQLSAALAAGGQYAFTQGQSETGTTLTNDVKSFVTSASAVSLSNVQVTAKGSTPSSCYCVNGSTPTFTGPLTCGATCTDGSGSTAGIFVTISGSFSYTPLFAADTIFLPASFTSSVTVRLQ